MNKFSVLPPIRAESEEKHSKNMDDPMSASQRTVSSRRRRGNNGEVITSSSDLDDIKMPTPPETEKHFVTVIACSHPVDDFRKMFSQSERFYFEGRELAELDRNDSVCCLFMYAPYLTCLDLHW